MNDRGNPNSNLLLIVWGNGSQHIDAVNALMTDKDFWATQAALINYPSAFTIFNEYIMIHALFCLYATEIYEKELVQQIIEKRVILMDRC